jgi:hypothetical protein
VAIGDFAVPRAVDLDEGTGWILIRPYLTEQTGPEPAAAVEEVTVLLPLVPWPRHGETPGRGPASSGWASRRRDNDGPPVGRHARRRRGGRWPVLLAAGGVAGLIAVGVLALANAGDRPGGSRPGDTSATDTTSRAGTQPQPADPVAAAGPSSDAATAGSAGTPPGATRSQTGPRAARSPSPAFPLTWTPPPAADLTGPITDLAGLCLASSDDRARLWNCDGTSSQAWTLAADGTLRLGGQCLQPGTGLARLRDCDGSAAQQWRVGPAGLLVNPAAAACLGDPESGANEGTPQRTAPCDESDPQRWILPGAGG